MKANFVSAQHYFDKNLRGGKKEKRYAFTKEHTLSLSKTNTPDDLDLINNSYVRKTCGFDNIPNSILKNQNTRIILCPFSKFVSNIWSRAII